MRASSSNSECTSGSHESSNPGEDPAVVAHTGGDGGEFDEAGGDHPYDAEVGALPEIADAAEAPHVALVADAAMHDHAAAHIAVAGPVWDVGVGLAESNKTAKNIVFLLPRDCQRRCTIVVLAEQLSTDVLTPDLCWFGSCHTLGSEQGLYNVPTRVRFRRTHGCCSDHRSD